MEAKEGLRTGLKKKYDILVIGAAIIDIPLRPVSKEIFNIESYPVDGINMTIGGDAINEATIITRLGHKVGLVSCVGDDLPGKFILEHCEKNKIDTSCIKINPEVSTSINVGLVTADGERTFITNRQGSLWKFRYEDILLSSLEETKILSFASIFNNPLFDEEALIHLFKYAKNQGILICADMIKPRLGETLEDIKNALTYIDYFFPNYDEASLMTGKKDLDDIADVFLDYGVKNVIIKTGKKGSFLKNSKESFVVPGYPHSKCIDTIGAGDNFASGFISALLEGKDFKSCGEFANAVASISVEYVGATTGVKNREQAEERYQLYLKEKGGQ